MAKIESTWLDRFALIFSSLVFILLAFWTLQGDFISNLLGSENTSTWQLIRSSGITAYILFTLSTIWGLALSSKIVKDWSPGSLSMLLHVSVSWLGVVMALLHALLLLFDDYVSYQISEIFIPFLGDYRPVAVGLGTLAFWLMVLVASSFAFKKHLGHANWKRLHYASYGGFFMVTAHAFFAGTDADRIGFQILLMLAMMGVVALTAYRIGSSTRKPIKSKLEHS